MGADIVIDSDLMTFAKSELTGVIRRLLLRPYPKLKLASGDIIPVVVDTAHAWDEEIQVFEFSHFGIATVIAGGSNDGGLVGVVSNKMAYKIRTISDYILVPWTAIMQAREKNIPLQDVHAQSMVYGYQKKVNSIGYDGDIDYGLQGIFTSQILRQTAVSTLAAAANGDVMLQILNNAVSSVVQNSIGLWSPKKLVLPIAQHQLIGNTMRSSGSDLSVLDAFLQMQEKMGQIEEVIPDDTLRGKGENGTDAMLVLPNGLESLDTDQLQDEVDISAQLASLPIYFAIMMEFDVPEEFKQFTDTMYRERGIARVGGTVVTDPFSGSIVSNI